MSQDDDLRFGDVKAPEGEQGTITRLLNADLENASERLIDLIQLIFILLIGYLVLASIASSMFGIPLPGAV